VRDGTEEHRLRAQLEEVARDLPGAGAIAYIVIYLFFFAGNGSGGGGGLY
jgi:hypothetical protein